jgi:hypothetical protein
MGNHYAPSLVLAAGIVLGTFISALTSESGWWVMAGPVVLAGAVLATREVQRRAGSARTASFGATLLLGATYIVTGVVMTLRDPSQVPLAVASLGTVSIVALGSTRR